MNNFYYIIYPDRSFAGQIFSLSSDDFADPEYFVSVDQFPMPAGLFNPVFDGENWIGTEPQPADRIYTQHDLNKAISSGNNTIVQEVAKKLVEQVDRDQKQAIEAESAQIRGIRRKNEAIANLKKIGQTQPLKETKKKTVTSKPTKAIEP